MHRSHHGAWKSVISSNSAIATSRKTRFPHVCAPHNPSHGHPSPFLQDRAQQIQLIHGHGSLVRKTCHRSWRWAARASAPGWKTYIGDSPENQHPLPISSLLKLIIPACLCLEIGKERVAEVKSAAQPVRMGVLQAALLSPGACAGLGGTEVSSPRQLISRCLHQASVPWDLVKCPCRFPDAQGTKVSLGEH